MLKLENIIVNIKKGGNLHKDELQSNCLTGKQDMREKLELLVEKHLKIQKDKNDYDI
jgi:hypothetical protein